MTTTVEALQNAADAVNAVAATLNGLVGKANDAIQTVTSNVLTTAITKTVYGAGADFADIYAAFDWVSGFKIAASGSVRFLLSAGQKTHTGPFRALTHPDGARITIEGTLNGAFPSDADLQVTGFSAAARNADSVANLALFRARIATELRFTNGGVLTLSGNLNLKNLLVTSSADVAGLDLILHSGGTATLTGVATHGAAYRGASTRNGTLVVDKVVASACGESGVGTSFGGSLVIRGNLAVVSCGGAGSGYGLVLNLASSLNLEVGRLFVAGNKSSGIIANDTSIAYVWNATGGTCVIDRNGDNGLLAFNGGRIVADNATITNNASYGALSGPGSFISAYGINQSGNGLGASSPAYNTVSSTGAVVVH